MISAERYADNGTITYGARTATARSSVSPTNTSGSRKTCRSTSDARSNPLDLDETRKIVVIGTAVAERLFDKGVDPVGKDVRVKDVVMKVVGVFYDKGNRGQNSERVLIPLIDDGADVWRRRDHRATSGCGPRKASTDSSSRKRCSSC